MYWQKEKRKGERLRQQFFYVDRGKESTAGSSHSAVSGRHAEVYRGIWRGGVGAVPQRTVGI